MAPTMAILTALPKEHAAVQRLLKNKSRRQVENDPTIYTLGTIAGENGNHEIVVANLSKYANNPAAITGTNVVRSFPTIRDIIFVGIAAGIPRPERPDAHVRLGDVVVSSGSGVVQFDLGAATTSGFQTRDTSPPPSARLLQAVNMLETEMITGHFRWAEFLTPHLSEANVRRPQKEPGKDFRHPADPFRVAGIPRIFRGKIGASNSLLRDSGRRDEVAQAHGLLAIEMEGSGIADASWEGGVGYLVIRSSCDYANSGKSDLWQEYAANVAAVYLAALLAHLPGRADSAEQTTSVRPADRGTNASHNFLAASAKNGQISRVQVSHKRLTSCVWKSDQTSMFTSGFDAILYEQDPNGLQRSTVSVGTSTVRAMCTDERWPYLLLGDDEGGLYLKTFDSDRIHRLATLASPIYTLAPGFLEDRVVTGDKMGRLIEWAISLRKNDGGVEVPSAHQLRIVHSHDGALFSALYDAPRDRYISVGSDGQLSQTDVSSGQTKSESISSDALFCVSVGKYRSLLAAGDASGRVWLKGLDAPGETLLGHTDTVRCLSMSPGENWLATGSKDGTVRIWHLASGKVWLLSSVSDYVYDVAFSPTGSRLAACDGSGTLTMVDFKLPIDRMSPLEMHKLNTEFHGSF